MKTPRLPDSLLWPATFGLPLRDRILWPVQIGHIVLILTTLYAVFRTAGGDLHHLLADNRPLYATGFTIIGMALVSWLTEYEARTTERTIAGRAARIRGREERLRMDSPYRLQVAERAVIAAAFQIERAQLPAEHPQYHDLREAVSLLRRAISDGDVVHRDTLAAYRHVFGIPARSARLIVAGIVRTHGPIPFHEIATMLRDGTDTRPPLMVSSAQLSLYLRDPDNPKQPATWLAPRQQGEPYQHRDNLTATV